MRVYLVGFMGVGKTTVGRLLAAGWGWELVDIDAQIERAAGCPVAEIFAQQGEAAFRRLEADRLHATGALPDVVVATGGGIYASPEHREWIARHGVAVWLNLPFDDIVARMSSRGRARRPLLGDLERARALYRDRMPAYREADLEVVVGPRDRAAAVAERIRSELTERSCAT